MTYPDYWNGLNWVKGWNPDYHGIDGTIYNLLLDWNDGVERDNSVLINLVEKKQKLEKDAQEALKSYYSAWLPRETPLFEAIGRYLSRNIEVFSYTSCKGEDARMSRATTLLRDIERELPQIEQRLLSMNSSHMSQEDFDTIARLKVLTLQQHALKKELGEKKGTANPPQSAPVEVTSVKVIKNDTVWQRYHKMAIGMHFDRTDPVWDYDTFMKQSSRNLFHMRGSHLKAIQDALKAYHSISKMDLGERYKALQTLRATIVSWVNEKTQKGEWDSNTRKEAVMTLLAQVDEALESRKLPEEHVSQKPLKDVDWTVVTENFPVIDDNVGEVYLLHGTTETNFKLIANGGFRPDLSANYGTPTKPRYGALGQGTYFSDTFAKVMTYTLCPRCMAYRCDCRDMDGNLVERYVMIARTFLGVSGIVRHQESQRQKSINDMIEGKDSIYGMVGFRAGHSGLTLWDANEFLIKKPDQMYPELVVYWRFRE